MSKKVLCLMLSMIMAMTIIPFNASAMERYTYEGYDNNYWNSNTIEQDFYLQVGGRYTIPYLWYSTYNYSYCKVETVSGIKGQVVKVSNRDIDATGEGQVRITFYDENNQVIQSPEMENDYITVTVRNGAEYDTQTVYTTYDEYGYYDVTACVTLNTNIIQSKSCVYSVERSDYYGSVIHKIDFSKDKIYFKLYEKGITTFTVNIEGKETVFKFKLVPVKLNKSYIMAYKDKSEVTVKVKSSNAPSNIKFSSSNTKVAKVGKTSGKVTFKKRGRAYIKAMYGDKVIAKCLVEVTYKKQYLAVKNAWKDINNSKIKYSQAKRTSKNYRDCSAFVSRCYYDASLGRKLYTIGPSSARKWPLTAAGQAKWLNSKGKKIATKQVSKTKLLPGDLVYYVTGYAGSNSEWKGIDHAAIYLGNGLIGDTVASNGSGAVGYREYDFDSRVAFIGRPLK